VGKGRVGGQKRVAVRNKRERRASDECFLLTSRESITSTSTIPSTTKERQTEMVVHGFAPIIVLVLVVVLVIEL